jgi:hypothetical protein
MNNQWLYGPKVARNFGLQPYTVQPTTIDIETVADLADLIELRVQGSNAKIYVTDAMRTRRRQVTRDGLSVLDANDRRHLLLEAYTANESSFVWMPIRADRPLFVEVDHSYFTDNAPVEGDRLAIELAEKVANNGTPIFVWSRVLTVLPWCALLLLATAWFASEIIVQMPIPLHVVGWTFVVFAAFVAHIATREAKNYAMNHRPGVRIR